MTIIVEGDMNVQHMYNKLFNKGKLKIAYEKIKQVKILKISYMKINEKF